MRQTDRQIAGIFQAAVAPHHDLARAGDDTSGEHNVGIDETSIKRGDEYITVIHLPGKQRALQRQVDRARSQESLGGQGPPQGVPRAADGDHTPGRGDAPWGDTRPPAAWRALR